MGSNGVFFHFQSSIFCLKAIILRFFRFSLYMKWKFSDLIIIFLACVAHVGAQTFTLQGRVTDDKLNPIELASVSVVKQQKVALTSLKGEFNLQLESADSVVVSFSMIGYKTKTRVLRNPRGKQTLQIILFEDDYTLNEVSVSEMKRQTGQTQELKKEDVVAVFRLAYA